MATRINRVAGVLAASATAFELTGAPLQPPTGLKWTIVELRPFFDRLGRIQGKYDTELYHEIDQRDVIQYNKPHTVALDIVVPHKYDVLGFDDSTLGQNVGMDIVIEESVQA